MKKLILLSSLLSVVATTGYSQCASNEIEVAVQILTDNYGYECYWNLLDSDGNVITQGGQGGTYASNAWYGDTVCVPDNECIRFEIFDTFGDGICCGYGQGSYTVYVDGVQIATGGNYATTTFHMFNCPPGSTCSDPFVITEGSYVAPNDNTWYEFTPEQNGTYAIEACNNACDTRLWIYDYCTGLIWADDNTGTIYYDSDQGGCGPQAMIGTALLEGGNTYYIRVGSDNNDCTGSINWSLTYNGPVVGCMDPSACNYSPLATVAGNCIYPGDPACPDGPDLIVVQDVLASSMYLSSMSVPANDCRVEENCLNGYGLRDILRFTTHIKNIGNLDYYIGSPSANPDQFDFQNCHNHTHYKGYAEYRLYDMQGNLIPIGFKNGFCVMDLECSGGGVGQYGCSTMGISHGCGDIYSSGLDCQWIDITDVDTGLYTFVNTTNWDNDPDALGHTELNMMNNWAQVCIYIGRDANGALFVNQVQDCEPYVDCAGQIYGNSQLDCNGDCGGSALRGDLNEDLAQNQLDAHQYVSSVLANDITAASCNDLNADGEIDVYDAALLVDCSQTIDGHPTGSTHDHCNFPYGLTNIYDTVQFSIGHVDHNQHFIDVYIKNPFNFVVAYQLKVSGLTIESVENLVDANAYPITPEWSLGGNEIIGISYQDSLIPKYTQPTPLCRIHYFQLTDTVICINHIQSVVNQDYEETVASVDPYNACIIAYTGIDELDNGGIELSMFPNPMDESTTLQIINRFNANINVDLVDPTGKTVRSYGNVTTDRLVIDKGNLTSGLYLVQISSKDRILNREKLIVE